MTVPESAGASAATPAGGQVKTSRLRFEPPAQLVAAAAGAVAAAAASTTAAEGAAAAAAAAMAAATDAGGASPGVLEEEKGSVCGGGGSGGGGRGCRFPAEVDDTAPQRRSRGCHGSRSPDDDARRDDDIDHRRHHHVHFPMEQSEQNTLRSDCRGRTPTAVDAQTPRKRCQTPFTRRPPPSDEEDEDEDTSPEGSGNSGHDSSSSSSGDDNRRGRRGRRISRSPDSDASGGGGGGGCRPHIRLPKVQSEEDIPRSNRRGRTPTTVDHLMPRKRCQTPFTRRPPPSDEEDEEEDGADGGDGVDCLSSSGSDSDTHDGSRSSDSESPPRAMWQPTATPPPKQERTPRRDRSNGGGMGARFG